MSIPLQITYRHLASSGTLDFCVREELAALSANAGPIRECHAVIELARLHPRRFRVHLRVSSWSGEVEVTHTPPEVEGDAVESIRAAFDAARRQLHALEGKRRDGPRRASDQA